MRYRFTFFTGLAVGFVVGARAGRERYEQMKKLARTAADSPAMQQLAGAPRPRRATWPSRPRTRPRSGYPGSPPRRRARSGTASRGWARGTPTGTPRRAAPTPPPRTFPGRASSTSHQRRPGPPGAGPPPGRPGRTSPPSCAGRRARPPTGSRAGVRPPSRPGIVLGQLLGDPVVEALALQRVPDVRDGLAERVGDLGFEFGQRGLGGPPFRRQPGRRGPARGVRCTVLLRARPRRWLRTRPAVRIAATFWLTAEWVSCTDSASSVMVIGPRACSRRSSIT